MSRIPTLFAAVMATLLTNPRALTAVLPRRDERGSNSIEQLIWIGVIVAIAIAIGAMVTVYVRSKMPTA